jgi:hypothetical protein
LTLNRNSASISGGESQWINLATLGSSSLVGYVYLGWAKYRFTQKTPNDW